MKRQGRRRLLLAREIETQPLSSGALADRLDILVAIRQPSAAEIGGPPGEPSAAVRERVAEARERQEARLGAGRCNAEMSPAEARDCVLGEEAAALLAESYSRRRLSGRAHDRVLRLARTIADLAGAEPGFLALARLGHPLAHSGGGLARRAADLRGAGLADRDQDVEPVGEGAAEPTLVAAPSPTGSTSWSR